VIECVPNVSEGRDNTVLDALRTACGPSLLDWHADADHHRSVFTLLGPGRRDAEGAVRQLARAVARVVDLSSHSGVHPRLGALDVVPFVALHPTDAARAEAVEAAHSFARWWSQAYEVPCFMYDMAHADNRDLPEVRRTAFKRVRPDYGPSLPHVTLGATAVGARLPMIAVNCLLLSRELDVANRIARSLREANGGLPGVRALGFRLDAEDRAQVSMNLVDLGRTGLEDAVLQVRELARAERTEVIGVELVGLAPAAELDRCSDEFLTWAKIDANQSIEFRLHERDGAAPPAGAPTND
jgi:glutamate formiminotransferase